MTPEAFERAVRELLDTVAVMTLATCAASVSGGTPWATDVYFTPDGYDLIFFSSPDSRHCRNLTANPACAAAVHPPASSWREIRGLQMEGEVRPITTVEAKVRATARYMGKFPFALELMSNPSEIASRMAKVSVHVFTPLRIRYLDNSLGFGARYTVVMKDGSPSGPPKRVEDA